MTSTPGDLQQVVERNAQAVMTGNFLQLMADITPEALAKLMAMAPPQAGQMSITSLPPIERYELEQLPDADEAQQFRATFYAENATASIVTAWKQVLGQWKVVDFREVLVNGGPPSQMGGG